MTDLITRLRDPVRDSWDAELMDEAADEIEQLRAGAMRYRWLRDVALGMDQIADPDNGVQVWWGMPPHRSAYGKNLDEAVDRAMKEQKYHEPR